MLGEFAPKLAELTDDVLFEDIWNRPELSARDRSLITVAVLTAGGNTDQLGFHLGRAIDNGVTQEELLKRSPMSRSTLAGPKACPQWASPRNSSPIPSRETHEY